MRISRIELTNWKNFKTVGVDLPARVFLVGPNASGKSNFLDALRFLRDIALAGGGLQKACSDRGGVSKLRCLASRKNSEVALAVELAEGNKKLWRYEIAFAHDNRQAPHLLREVVYKDGRLAMRRPDKRDTADPLRLSQTALEQISENRAFREVAGFFKSVFYLHLVPQLIRNPGSLSDNGGAFVAYGHHFLEHLAKTPEKIRAARLQRIFDTLAPAIPQLKELKLANDAGGAPHLVEVYEHWRLHASQQNEEQFSDGTLRLFGLLWALQEGHGPLLLEEPELSLHAGLVQRLARLVHRVQKTRKRQILISTHSVDLLSDPGIGGDEVLMLKPNVEGTQVIPASDNAEIRALLESGMNVADTVFPHTEPERAADLELVKL